jgi:predicted Zn finger-like uncharacterized protein
MFTVCPKCALTLVVTAADLRVAQGYVRCGRCSNVFNALSRLSEDRQSASAAAQAQSAPEPAPDPKPASSATTRTRPPQDSSTSTRTRQATDATPSANFRLPSDPSATSTRKAVQPPPPPRPPEPKRYDDNSIPEEEEDLEFNPDATDLNKVFVEPPPSPKFTAATGTFKALRLEAEDSARAEEQLARTDERETPEQAPFDPTDTQVDVEIDSELLASITGNRLQRLDPTHGIEESSTPPEQPPPAPPNSASSTGTSKALAAPKPTSPPKQPLHLQPPMEQPPQPAAPMRLAERAKARAEAARTGTDTTRVPDAPSKPDALKRGTALETTTRAIRAALTPRRRSISPGTTPTEQPTSFFAGMWTAGSALLLLILTIQVVHHYRHDLAANATLNGPLTSIYAVLGIPLVPRWDLGAYEVRQLGASTAADAPGQIRVLASVKNVARQAQPLPLLRVTLQDRFGNRIASRDVPPQSYLPRAIPRSSLLSAGQRIDAEMAFVDPGSNAVGFEIDACLPSPEGGIACANDAAR